MSFQSDREKIYEAYRKVVESRNPHFKIGDLVRVSPNYKSHKISGGRFETSSPLPGMIGKIVDTRNEYIDGIKIASGGRVCLGTSSNRVVFDVKIDDSERRGDFVPGIFTFTENELENVESTDESLEDLDSVYSIEAIYGYPGEYDTDIERGEMRWVPHGLSWRIAGAGSTYPSAERAMEEAESLCSKVSSGESNPYGCTSVNYIRIVGRDERGGGKHTVSVAVGPIYGKGDFNGLKWIDVSDIAGGERSIDELANDYQSFLSSHNLYGEELG